MRKVLTALTSIAALAITIPALASAQGSGSLGSTIDGPVVTPTTTVTTPTTTEPTTVPLPDAPGRVQIYWDDATATGWWVVRFRSPNYDTVECGGTVGHPLCGTQQGKYEIARSDTFDFADSNSVFITADAPEPTWAYNYEPPNVGETPVYFRVRAIDSYGQEGPWSNVVAATIPA